MSDTYAEADAVLNYTTPADSPGIALGALYGEVAEAPDTVDTVEVYWTPKDYPGIFVARELVAGNWQSKISDHIAYEYWIVQQLYALDGGWPTPPEFPPAPATSGGPIGYV